MTPAERMAAACKVAREDGRDLPRATDFQWVDHLEAERKHKEFMDHPLRSFLRDIFWPFGS